MLQSIKMKQKKKNTNSRRKLNDDIANEEKRIRQSNEDAINQLNEELKKLNERHKEISDKIERDKETKMDKNDEDIDEKRKELDLLKKHYETTKLEHKTQEDQLKEKGFALSLLTENERLPTDWV